MNPLDVATGSLLVVSVTFVALAVAGLFRFGDVFCRLHAATKAITLGVLLALLAAGFQMGETGDAVKLALTGALLVVTAPVSAHMISRAAYFAEPGESHDLVEDHLADDLSES